ncbi:hypothetical protein EGW08_013908 [Elysia chlorotica]|uniref:Uncharacterized protein n=1 Tax=Elysia chlorotica TaxID=188477 RepID=A0A433T9X5_ELYCH|nr:hypothetical protein EGW08_013908 [Elysia chlorotica]
MENNAEKDEADEQKEDVDKIPASADETQENVPREETDETLQEATQTSGVSDPTHSSAEPEGKPPGESVSPDIEAAKTRESGKKHEKKQPDDAESKRKAVSKRQHSSEKLDKSQDPKEAKDVQGAAASSEKEQVKPSNEKAETTQTKSEPSAKTDAGATVSSEKEQVKPSNEKAETTQTKAEPSGKTDVSSVMETTNSLETVSSRADVEEEGNNVETIVWEWEQELEEYDEPDIYPSEKDYIMVPVQVEITDEEEQEMGEPAKEKMESENLEQGEQSKDTQSETAEKEEQSEDTQSKKVEKEEPSKDAQPKNDEKEQSKDAQSEKVDKEEKGKDAQLEKVLQSHHPEENRERESSSSEKSRAMSEESIKTNEKEGIQEKTQDKDPDGAKDQVEDGEGRKIKDEGEDILSTEEQTKEKIESDFVESGTKSIDGETDQQKPTDKEPKTDTEVPEKNDDGDDDGKARDIVDEVGLEKKVDVEHTTDMDLQAEGSPREGDAIEKGSTDENLKEETSGKKDDSTGDSELQEETNDDKEIPEDGEDTKMVSTKHEDGISESEINIDGEIGESELAPSEQTENEIEIKVEKASEDGKKVRDKKSIVKETPMTETGSLLTTEDALDPGDEFEEAGLPEAEAEPAEPPPKRYKTVMVRTLVPRPPKIHYVPEEERTTHITNDKHLFRKRPISLVMSFGYDCQRMANLHVLDKETVVFMSGFVLTFFNHVTKEQTFLRCIGGSCFGALAIHPSKRLFAAAEKGEKPIIGIWSYPKLQLFRKLREGTNRVYASVNFSPCGRFLASQGGEPDYLITVYNWLAETPVVRVKSHAQDVFRVTFSKELAGRLTTSGLCHIKFWKMATTFTGLKLKGDIGRFGRTELSDIEGYIEMPDGKVLSGTEWGNMLLWENGLIVAEVCIKPEIPCHEGIIRQITQVESEFYTTGQDGWVRSWPFDTVDAAEINTTEESLKVSVKSSGQVLIKEHSDIWFIVPDIPDGNSNSVFWFAQDGKGSILRADLSFLNTAKEPYQVLTAHGGAIVSSATSKNNCIMATLGADGQIRVYDYIKHKLLACRTFSSAGTTMLWPGVLFDPTCCTIIAGFADGTFRAIRLSGKKQNGLPMSLVLHQVRKPHQRRLTCLDIDFSLRFLATGGEDGTVFFFDIANDYLPLFFVSMPDFKPVVSIKWAKQEIKDLNDEETSNRMIAALQGGTLIDFLMPKATDFDNSVSYLCTDVQFLRRLDFESIKSELQHNEEIELERLAEEQLNAALEIENRKRLEEGLESESQQNLRLLEEAEEQERMKASSGPKKKWQPHKPSVKSPLSLMIPSLIDHDEVFLSMGGYDAGYLYSMRFGEQDKSNALKENPSEPVGSTKIEDSKDQAITAYCITNEGDYVFWGFSDGRIRVQNVEYPYALEHIDKHWTEGIHDCIRGEVTSISLDKDGVFLITTGNDGNCFLLSRMMEKELGAYLKRETLQPVEVVQVRDDVVDIVDTAAYTLEVFKKVAKEMALLAEAKKNKAAKREEIARLRIWYNDVLKKNNELPEEVRLTATELALTKDRESRRKEDHKAALEQLKLETAWYTQKAILSLEKLKSFYIDNIAYELFELRSFNSCSNLWSFRMNNLPSWFMDAKDKVDTHVTPHSVDSDTMPEDVSVSHSESLLLSPKPKREPGMDKFVHQRLTRLWERKKKRLIRAREWKMFLRTEPKSKELREEDKAIEEARANMGDMKLKSAADYKVPESKKLTEHRGRKRLVLLEETMFNYKQEFNEQMLKLRLDKIEKLGRMKEYRQKIIECHKKLSIEDQLPVPEIKPMVITENPKRTLEYTLEDVREYKRQIEEKLKASAPVAKVVKKQEGPSVKRKGPVSAAQKPPTTSTKTNEKDTETKIVPEQSSSLDSFAESIPEVFTPLEEMIKRTEITKAKFWQNYYIVKINEEKQCFDAKLKLLRHRKLKLDFLLKTGDARMTLLTQEFILAQQSEALEASLEMKIHDTTKEKRECTNVMKSLSKKLEHIKKEVDAYGKQRNALFNEVVALAVSKAPAFEKYLVRVFSKRMPKTQVRPSARPSEGSRLDFDSDDDESSDESDMDMDISDDEDDGLDIDFPPPELNKEIYDSVVDIRSRRFVIDEAESSIREQLEEVNLIMAQYKQRVNVADREYERGRRELDGFRKEKQEKQNVLHCAVNLNLHQIEEMGRDMSKVLVTENRNINELQQRIPELHKEKVRQKAMGMEMKKLNMQLHKEKCQFHKRLQEMHKKCDHEMLVKFGQIRPVDELEYLREDPRIVSLKQELRQLQERNEKDLQEWDSQINEAAKAKAVETMKSISRLQMVGHITARVHEMNKSMEEQMSKLPSEIEDTLASREIAFLKVVLTDQWNTISALSLEIAQLTQRQLQPLPPIKTKVDTLTDSSEATTWKQN